VAKLDTVINVITIQGVDSTRKAKVAHHNDGYNRLEILDLGDSSIVTGQIRNRITNLAYSGLYPASYASTGLLEATAHLYRSLLLQPPFWHGYAAFSCH
jgi:hypothetical protein